MKKQKNRTLIAEKKIPIFLIYSGLLACTVFTLFLIQTLKQNRNQSRKINNLHSTIVEKDNKISLSKAYAGSLIDQQKIAQKQLEKLHSSHEADIQKITSQLENKQLSYNELSQQLNLTTKDLEKIFTKVDSSVLENVETLEKWSEFAITSLQKEASHTRFFHSILANKYFLLGQVEKTQLHLGLAKNIDPVLNKKLNDGLNLDSSFTQLEDAIKTSSDASTVEAKFKIIENLIQKLKDDPDKQPEFLESSLRVLNLRSQLSLKAPPKKALSALDTLLLKQKEISLDPNSLTIHKLHFLDICTNAYQLAAALDEDKKKVEYEALVIKVTDILAKDPKQQHKVHYSLGIIALDKLDHLFIDGNPTQIFNMIAVLEKHANLVNSPFKSVFIAAAQGHRAAVYIEQGKKTSARNITAKSISDLSALCKKEPSVSLAHYRLGILYWMQALFTSKTSQAIDSLKKSKLALAKALIHTTPIIERNILQFTAMVDGDLGHYMIGIGKKTEAKDFFSKALKNWELIQSKWGSNTETKEGVDYCKWRVQSL